MRIRSHIIFGVIIMGGLFFTPGSVLYARVSAEVLRGEYRALLGRDPIASERVDKESVQGSVLELRKKLNVLPERTRAITVLYRELLLRRPRPHELSTWIQRMTPVKTIRDSLLVLPERQSIMDDLYLNYFGRYPNGDERTSNNRRGVSYEKLRVALTTGAERRGAIVDRFAQMLGRAPDDTELTFFLSTGQSLDFIGQNTQPVARAGEDQVVANDTPFITLDGSASADLEGASFTYTWTVLETPPDAGVTLSDPTSARPSFRVPASAEDPLYQQGGIYRFQLVVFDGQTKSTPDEIEIRVQEETQFEQQLLGLVNGARKTDGGGQMTPLVFNPALQRAARKYSRSLFVNTWFESIDRDGKSPADRARIEGYDLRRVGENIALIKSKVPLRLTAKRVQGMYDGWYASVDHKKNLLKGDSIETGIGFFAGQVSPNEYRIYLVQVFAVPKPEVLPEPVKVPPADVSVKGAQDPQIPLVPAPPVLPIPPPSPSTVK